MRAASIRRVAATGLLLFAALYPRTASGQSAALPSGPEPGFFSLRVGDLPAQTLTVMVDERTLLLPFADVMELVGTPYGVGTGERFWSESGEGVAADTVVRQLTTDSLTVQLGSGDVVLVDGAVYVAADRIAEVLHASLDVSWSTLAVHLDREQPFPSEVAAASERRRAMLVPAVPRAGADVVFRPRWGGLVLDWEFSGRGLDIRRNAALSPTLSTAVWGGELRVGATAGTDARGDAAAVQPLASFSRVFPTGTVIRQFEAGDVLASGVVAEQLKGFRITNTPHRQVDVFGLVPIRADLPPGWEYEVYQDGRLVGFSDAISDGSPPAAIRYGTTGVRIREIAPNGEQRVRDLTFSVPFSMAPKGALRYDLGAGACRWRGCEWGAFGGLRYGLTHGVTVGGGINYRGTADSAQVVVPHASIAVGTTRGLSGELQVERGGAGYANVQFAGPSRFSFSGGARIDRALQGGDGAAGVVRFWSSDASTVFRIGRSGLATARLTARADGQVHTGLQRWSTSGALYHSDGTIEVGFSAGPRASPRWDVRSTYLAPRFRRSIPASLTAAAGLDAKGIQRLDAGISLGLARFGSVTSNVRWERGARLPLLEIGFSASRGAFRVQGRASSDTARAPHRMMLSGAGSVAWVGMAGLRAVAGATGGAGGIVGRVFFDRDADGDFTAADSALGAQEVHVGGRAVRTDSQGRYAAWGLAPYDIATVRLPPAAVSNPNLTPSTPERRVRPNPDRVETVDFAVITTRAVSGQVVAVDQAEQGLGGVRLELRDGMGSVFETTTFEDGAWYVPRLRPGVYVVSVAESALRALDGVSEPVRLVVAPAGDDEIEAPQLALRWAGARPAVSMTQRDSGQNQTTPAAGAAVPAPIHSSTEDHDAQTTVGHLWAAYAAVRAQRVQRVQPSSPTRGGGRTDRRAGSDGALAPLRLRVLARPSGREDGRVEHRRPVLLDGASEEARAPAELPIGPADRGGAGAGDAPGGDENPRGAPPAELTYVIEERRTLRLRRGLARFVPR